MWGDGFLQISVALVAALSWGPGVKPGGKVSEKGEASAFRRHLCCPYSVWNGPFCFISKEDQENRKVNVDNVGNPYWNCDNSLFVLRENRLKSSVCRAASGGVQKPALSLGAAGWPAATRYVTKIGLGLDRISVAQFLRKQMIGSTTYIILYQIPITLH